MISLCIISRKEDSEQLTKAIKSCIPYIDEVIVVDTSKDGKVNTLTSVKGVQSEYNLDVKVVPFKWINDFSAARNFSFEQATHDVIFWLDSDDLLTGAENLRPLAKLIEDGKADWIYSRYNYHRDEFGNVDATHWKPRLFRKGTVRWQEAVHEDAIATTGVIQVKDVETELPPIVIEHQSDQEHHRASAERNLMILLDEYERDNMNTNARTLQYIGMSYEGLEQYPEAIEFFKKHIGNSGSKSDRYWSLHRISGCLYHLGDMTNAITVLMDSLKLYPEWQTSYFDLAALYYELGDWEKVIEWTLTGLDKRQPDILDVIDPQDYTIKPQCRLAEAFMMVNKPQFAVDIMTPVIQKYPKVPMVKERYEAAKESLALENYVHSFLTVVSEFRKYDRNKTAQLFDLIPRELDEDSRIQAARHTLTPPKKWNDKSVVIYCGDSYEDWAYPSVFTGIGGSETAVIRMSEQLAKLGYEVTVFNRCGGMKGIYNEGEGFVEYKPYYHFNPKDIFYDIIGWRVPGLFMEKLNARKSYLWLHDILYSQAINDRIIENVDKILFLSDWHSKNIEIPAEKIYLTNNGINPEDFLNLPEKKPNSLFWGSSYDRGLLPFAQNILPLIQEEIPDVTLQVCYGWQNILKEMDELPHLKELYTELSPILDATPGIIHHGRVGQVKLAKIMGESQIYAYASEFGETCNITSMQAQAAGCYVITTSQAGGTPERVRFGKVIKGDGIYTDETLQKEYAKAVIAYLKNPLTSTVDLKEFHWKTTAANWKKDLL